jgi:hypothetical protein
MSNNEDLFDAIEQFLDAGGEPEPAHPNQRIMDAFAAFATDIQAAIEPLVEAMQPLIDAMVVFAHRYLEFCEALGAAVMERTAALLIGMRRSQLRRRLEAWWVPGAAAQWIVNRWPQRWLPQLAWSTYNRSYGVERQR